MRPERWWHALCTKSLTEIYRRAGKSMLKIIMDQENPESLRVCLYGELTGEYLPELEKVLSAQSAGTRRIALDLSNVTFVDRAGMKYLCGMRSRYIAIENSPSYVMRWIELEDRCG
jgi:ABC-type transporter Mla MlaB component